MFLISLCAFVQGIQQADADSTPTSGQSTTTQVPSLLQNALNTFNISYWGNYNGPGFTNFTYDPTPDGNPGTGQYFDNIITTSYKFNENLLLGPAIEFYYRPVLGQDVTMRDVALRFQAKNVINTPNWNLKLEGWAFGPTTAASQQQNMFGGLEFVQSLNYSSGPLTVGTYSYVRQYAFDGPTSGYTDRRFYIAPNGSYALGKSVQATVWVDAWQYLHNRGDAGFMPSNYPWDIEPGFNWDINRNFSVNPYVNIFPGSPSLASTYFGMVIIGKTL